MDVRINRRQFPRFTVQPAYTPISVRRLDSTNFDIEGNAYDISEGGVRCDLDEAVAPGTPIAMQITLPTMHNDELESRSIMAFANVVWVEDEDEPGPVRTAAVFTHFARAGDRERLLKHFASGHYRIAA